MDVEFRRVWGCVYIIFFYLFDSLTWAGICIKWSFEPNRSAHSFSGHLGSQKQRSLLWGQWRKLQTLASSVPRTPVTSLKNGFPGLSMQRQQTHLSCQTNKQTKKKTSTFSSMRALHTCHVLEMLLHPSESKKAAARTTPANTRPALVGVGWGWNAKWRFGVLQSRGGRQGSVYSARAIIAAQPAWENLFQKALAQMEWKTRLCADSTRRHRNQSFPHPLVITVESSATRSITTNSVFANCIGFLGKHFP